MAKQPALKAKFTRITQEEERLDDGSVKPKKIKYAYTILTHQGSERLHSNARRSSSPESEKVSFPITKYEELDQPGPSHGVRSSDGCSMTSSGTPSSLSSSTSDRSTSSSSSSSGDEGSANVSSSGTSDKEESDSDEQGSNQPLVKEPKKWTKNPQKHVTCKELFIHFSFSHFSGRPYIVIFTCASGEMPHSQDVKKCHYSICDKNIYKKYLELKAHPTLSLSEKGKYLMALLHLDPVFKAIYQALQHAMVRAQREMQLLSNCNFGGA